MEVNLEDDKFTVSYDARVTSAERMKQVINELGYKPTIVQSLLAARKMKVPSGPLPEPIASLLKETDKPLLVDFYAEWCGACKLMESTTLKDPTLLKTLKRFHFIKIDADVTLSAMMRG